MKNSTKWKLTFLHSIENINTYDTSSTELYQKYIPTVEEMIETFDMLNQHLKKYLANWTIIILLTIFFSF